MTKGGKAKRKGYSIGEVLFGPAPKPSKGPRKSKSFNKSKEHHDSRKGGGGNNTGKRR